MGKQEKVTLAELERPDVDWKAMAERLADPLNSILERLKDWPGDAYFLDKRNVDIKDNVKIGDEEIDITLPSHGPNTMILRKDPDTKKIELLYNFPVWGATESWEINQDDSGAYVLTFAEKAVVSLSNMAEYFNPDEPQALFEEYYLGLLEEGMSLLEYAKNAEWSAEPQFAE